MCSENHIILVDVVVIILMMKSFVLTHLHILNFIVPVSSYFVLVNMFESDGGFPVSGDVDPQGIFFKCFEFIFSVFLV